MTRQEEAIQITMEQFIHDCGIEQEDEVAMAWFKARCHYLQAELLSEREKNKEMEERIRLFEATLKLIANPELQDNYSPQQLARHALRIEPLSPHPPEKEEQG